MGFDSKNQSRCKSSLIKRGQKVPKVIHADQCPAQPARASVSPLFKGGGCETGRRLSDLCFRKGVADAAVDPPEILPEPFPPAVHCLGGRTIRGERIFLRCHSVQDVLDGCIYIVLVRGEILWKLSVEPVTVSAPEAADHAVISLSAFYAADPAPSVTILQQSAAERAVTVFIFSLNRENTICRIEYDSFL